MTGRPASPTPRADVSSRVRRQLTLHRRLVSAGLAFLAVLLGLTAVSNAATETPDAATANTTSTSPTLTAEQLAVPIRLADPSVVEMLTPGDVVDVVVADQRGDATLVAADLTVTAVPQSDGSGPWTESEGMVVVAATGDQVLALAGAAARGPVTVAVHP